MKITINDHRKIADIQEEFSKMFPNLRVEFFAKPSKVGSAASKKLVIHSNNKTVSECRVIHENGTIELSPTMTKRQLLENFSDVFGLTAEIFRKSHQGPGPSAVGEKLSLEDENRAS